jgi:AAA15 family ATPase/GTPase
MPFVDIRAEKSKTEKRIPLREILTSRVRFFPENEIKTIHKFFSQDDREKGTKEFDLNDFESEGSKKFTALCGPLVEALHNGGILVIDELEARLHPLLTRFIVSTGSSLVY